MTDERMALIELIEKGADADLIRDMLAFAAERLMSLEVEALTGAPAGVRSPERLTHRNGYRERAWDTRAWAEGRPDKVIPRSGADLVARWRAELGSLGYRDPAHPVSLAPTPIGALDREAAVDTVLTRLAAGRSAWNAADIHGRSSG